MKSKSPVFIVNSTYSPYGGAETLALNIIQAILGYTDEDICLLTLPHQKWPIKDHRLKIIPLGMAGGHRLWKLLSFNMAVANYLHNHRATVIFSIDRISRFTHLHAGGGSHRRYLEVEGRHLGWWKRNTRKISLFHHTLMHLERKGFTNPSLKGIHCCSRMVALELHGLFHIPVNKLFICYNPIDWTGIGQVFVNREMVAAEQQRKYCLNPEIRWLLFLGSGYGRKGLDIAIRGLAHLPVDYHLLVVGSGNTGGYQRLAKRIGVANRVRFLGPQPRGWRFAAGCKALILPSYYEPFGLAAAEAQAMGLPVLVSDNTGFSELVEEGKNGVILELRNGSAGYADAFDRLQHLIEAPEYSREEMRSNVRHLDNAVVMQKLIGDFLGLRISQSGRALADIE